MQFNYFELLKFPVVKFVGFDELSDFTYITIIRSDRKIIVNAKEMKPSDHRFRIDFVSPDDKKVFNAQLFHLLNDYDLYHKVFIYNNEIQSYIPTSISIDDE